MPSNHMIKCLSFFFKMSSKELLFVIVTFEISNEMNYKILI